MAIGSNIRLLRERHSMTQEQLADKMGVSDKTISTWELGTREPRMGSIEKLASIFGVRKSDIIGDSEKQMDPPGSYRVDPAHIAPVVSTVAAGSGLAPVEDVDGYYLLPPDVKNPEEHRYFRVRGDSMEPDIKDGSMVLVHLQPQVENGELAVVIVNGDQGVVKRVQYQDGCLILLSINPAYPPRVIMGQELASTIIWGKVIYSWREH